MLNVWAASGLQKTVGVARRETESGGIDMKTQRKNPADPKRDGRRPGEEPGPSDHLQAMVRGRDRLCAEATEHPGSDAFDIVRAYVMTGMLARRRTHGAQAADTEPSGAERDRDLKEKISRLAQVAEAAEEATWAINEKKYAHAQAMVGRIAEMVGLKPPSGDYEEQHALNPDFPMLKDP
jgi:hypothetical protein